MNDGRDQKHSFLTGQAPAAASGRWFGSVSLFAGRSRGESLLLFIATAAIYAIPWAPIIGQLIVSQHYPVAVVGLFSVAATLAGLWVRAKAPRVARILSAAYWLALFGVNFVFGYFARWADPAYFWMAIALAAAGFASLRRPPLFSVVLLFSTVLTFGVLAYDLFFSDKTLVAACIGLAVGVLALIWWLVRRGRLLHFSRWAVAFGIFGALIYPRGFVSYSFVFPGHLSQVLSQPGVTAVYDYTNPKNRDEFCTQTMYLARVPGRQTLVAGPQNPCRRLIRLDPGPSPVFAFLDLGGRGGDNVAFDPTDANLAYVVALSDLLKVSVNPLRELARLNLIQSARNLNFIQYDPKTDRLYVSQDYGGNIWVVDRPSFRLVTSIPSAEGAVTDDVWIDDVGRQVFVSGTYKVGWRVDTYDLSTLARKNTYLRPWDIGFHFSTIDPVGRRAYLGSTTTGRVWVLDLDSLKEKGSFRLEVGLRNLNFDPFRRWVLIGGYFSGTLYAYDPDRARLVGSLFFGKRLRWVQVDRENGKWYVATSVGGFEIDPNRAFGIDQVDRPDQKPSPLAVPAEAKELSK